MACKSREEFIGKRFLSVKSDGKLKYSKISEWEWRSGFVRAVSTTDSSNADFTVLVEFDDTGWKLREYIRVHDVFQEFFVEHSLAWVKRDDPNHIPHQGRWPALCFKPVVDKVDLFQHSKRPVEFLSDRFLSIVDEKNICFYKEGDENVVETSLACPEVKKWVKKWTDYQDGQKILLTTPTVLLGYRVEVYRTEGTTQWYTAVIKSYNHATKSLTLTDDTVLEEHNEDPTLIQMHLIGDGVVDSILNGVDVGVAQRRRPRSTVIKQNSKDSSTAITNTRSVGGSHSTSGSSSNQGKPSSSGNSSPVNSTALQTPTPTASSTSTSNTTSTTSTSAAKTTTHKAGSLSSPITTAAPSFSTTTSSSSLASPAAVEAKESTEPTKGQANKTQKPPSKRKSDPPAKTPKKSCSIGGKKLKKSASEESLTHPVSPPPSLSPVCKQTCNVIVERIEEENKRQSPANSNPASGRDRNRYKPPRLRDKSSNQNRRSREPAEEEEETTAEEEEETEASSPACVSSSRGQVKASPSPCDNNNRRISSRRGRSGCESKEVCSFQEESSVSQKNKGEVSNVNEHDSKQDEKRQQTIKKSSSNSSSDEQIEKSKGRDSKTKCVAPISTAASTLLTSSSFLFSASTSSSKPLFSPCEPNTAVPSGRDNVPGLPTSSVKPLKSSCEESSSGSKKDDICSLVDKNLDIRKDVVNFSDVKLSKQTGKLKESEGIKEAKKGVIPEDNSEEDNMHFKKHILRTGNTVSPSPNNQTSISEGIDVNRSLTDQITKRNKTNFPLNGDGKINTEFAASSGKHSPSAPLSLQYTAGRDIRPEVVADLSKAQDFGERHSSAFTYVPRSNTTSVTEDRADSRASDGQLPTNMDDKRPNSRLDDLRSVKSSPGSSPLVVDKHEAVHPYRDPELMRMSAVQSNVQTLLAAQQKMSQQSFPVVHAQVPGASTPSQGPPGAFSSVPPLPPRALLNPHTSAMSYTTAHPLPPSMSHHPLSLPHHSYTVAQHQQMLLQQPMLGYPVSTAALESLWQRKPTPLPQPWLLQKNQEGLLPAEFAALQREQLHLLREQQERREIEREREQRREREKEAAERERMEKEKEREKAERERIERDRLEKERMERERQEWEHKQNLLKASSAAENPERILRASVDTDAAVNQHFAASLTILANQKGIGSNVFSITRGTPQPRSFIPKSDAHHPLPPAGLSYPEKTMFEAHRKEEKVKRETEQTLDDKRFSNKVNSEKPSNFPSYPYSSGNFSATSIGSQPGQKPVFNLYGLESSPSTISTEQLRQRGLIPDARQIKDEPPEKKHSFAPSHPSSAPVLPSHGYPVKDVKRESHNSVIVKRECKPGVKQESPMAAHSHHNSPSSSSPRPQHPRPAHTPEHRPDRPLSSASPASGVPAHLLHHSNPVTSGPAHLTPTQNPTYFVPDTHGSPRSQSPFKMGTSQSQTMPQPLDYCKASSVKLKPPESQQNMPLVHSGYPVSIAQAPVSSANSSLVYSNSFVQQGLVPNPIYSQPSSHSPHHNQLPLGLGGPSPSMANSRPSQHSPQGSKRKPGSKEPNSYCRKKQKGGVDMPNPGQPVSIPVTTPQIITNPSPYTTTTSSSTIFNKPGLNSNSSSSLPATSFPSMNHHESLKSFVETTVQIAFQQNEKKENAEKEHLYGTSSLGNKPVDLASSKDSSTPPLHSRTIPMTSSVHVIEEAPNPISTAQGTYSSRIMDTINRVAKDQVDTDSDTLSASSPPPQIKPSDTNSPLSKSINSSGSSHPHHMKKAWLQRHDEDKKSETPVFSNVGEDDSNSSLSHTKDIISCVENSSASLNDRGQESISRSPANVVVTLPNGNISDLNHHNDESTSSASETETQSPSKIFGSGAKKRVKPRKPTTWSNNNKKTKTEGEQPSPSTTPPPAPNSRKKVVAPNKQNKGEREIKSKDEMQNPKPEEHMHSSLKQSRDNSPQPSKMEDSATPPTAGAVPPSKPVSPQSVLSEQSSPSPALSESNTATSSVSSASTTSTITTSKVFNSNSKENKDKKKTRRSKENNTKEGKKSSSFNKPLVRQSVATLKRTMVPFIQDGSCTDTTPKQTKCRECRMTQFQRSKKLPNIFCRFYAFRRLRYNNKGMVKIEGFSELSDADPDDIQPWLPRFPVEEPELDVENSKFIIAKVGDKFCELVEQEKEAKTWAGEDVKIVWKRAVQGVREMCDVCDTTLFNMHWVCRKCGFVVCLDCYKVRIKEGKKPLAEDKWLNCSSNRQAHDAREMMLTQIIPSDALWELGRLIHDIRRKWSIPSNCPCGNNTNESTGRAFSKNGINQQLLHAVNNHKMPNGLGSDDHANGHTKPKKHQDTLDSYNPATSSSPLSILAEVAATKSNQEKGGDKRKLDKTVVPGDEYLEEGDKKGCSTLLELLTKTARKPKAQNDKKSKKGSGTSTLDDIIQSVVKTCMDSGAPFKFLHYTPRLGGWKRELPIMVHSLTETSVLYPDVPHSWLCEGRLLRLHDAHQKGNLQIFQEQWNRGQPVLVSCAHKAINQNLWKPAAFGKEFGHIENEVVNCRTGDVIIGHTMSEFWDGFENLGNRPTDKKVDPMLLKLKDWPPGDDFSELLPSRFNDLMQALPLPEYTRRDGKLNLASRLPDFLVRPDLGPKMYNAYGSSHFPKEGTTNLHLDISDAVNVMVYVGIPGDGPGGRKAEEHAALKAIDDVGCDSITKRRAREVDEIPGALWHIYDAHDADKIRDFLNKVAKERGEIIETDHDAIHDQSWYIDKELSDRLYNEYGVQSYTIVQCLGDAIFIPAGAPHQVRNLHSCVKVAEDFVSPEHLNHCFRLTQEFRQLSETHSNHEDKLQVKNIIYHAVKDAIAVLQENEPEDD